jgi:hypothetical protein
MAAMRGLQFAVLGVALVGVLSGCSSRPISGLTPGECFNFSDATMQVTSVAVVECAKPHGAEVFATFNVALPTFSADALAAATDDQCLAAFEPYVGYPYSAAKVYYRALMPGADGWNKGARTVVCFVVPSDGTLTGSVKKSAG